MIELDLDIQDDKRQPFIEDQSSILMLEDELTAPRQARADSSDCDPSISVSFLKNEDGKRNMDDCM